MRTFRNTRLVFLLYLILGLVNPAPEGLAEEVSENPSVKAFYLYNLLLFVDWPEDALKTGDPFCVAILGDDALYSHLKRLDQKTAKRQKLEIRRIQEGERWPDVCKVLFIGSSKRAFATELLAKLRNKPVLTVSTLEGFPSMGGMIRLKNLRGPVTRTSKRFTVNLGAVEKSGLKLRARLLRLSDIFDQP